MDLIIFLVVSIIKILFQLVLEIIGIFLIPIFLLRTEEFTPKNSLARILPNGKKNRKFKDKWFDSIWGNENDGIYGDINYWNVDKRPPSYLNAFIWTAIRNPIHNFSLKMGVDDIIVKYEEYHLTKYLIYSIAYGKKKYRLLRYKRDWYLFNKCIHTDLYIGYKNFNVKNQELPKHFKYQFAIKLNFFRKCKYF